MQGAILATPGAPVGFQTELVCHRLKRPGHLPRTRNQHSEEMGAKTLTLPSSHLPMLSYPEKVADFVIEAAGSLGASAATAR